MHFSPKSMASGVLATGRVADALRSCCVGLAPASGGDVALKNGCGHVTPAR
jgi:hypothetical protein